MSTVVNDEKKVARGLQVRTFDGSIAATDNKAEIKYTYDRIVLPWSRTGKDHQGKDVEGAVPTMHEVVAFVQNALGFTSEFKLDASGNPETNSVVGFLIDGLNLYMNRIARVKAENTPDAAKEKAIQVVMSKTGMSRQQAVEFLTEAFSK